MLELECSSSLDFGGINSTEAEAALRRAAKGGMVSAPQFRGVVSLCTGKGKE